MLDSLMQRTWKNGYTCHEFACEAWQKITGNELILKNAKEIKELQSPCIVFLYNGDRQDSHVGIYFEGRVIHLSVKGVQYIPFEILKISFKNVRFYQ